MARYLPLILLLPILLFSCNTADVNVKSWVGMDEKPVRMIDQARADAPEPEPAAVEAPADGETNAVTAAAVEDGQTVTPAPAEATAVETSADAVGPGPFIAVQEKALNGQRTGIGVSRNQEIEDYLNSVLHRLQQAWPNEPVPSYVFLRPNPEFCAFSTDQAIFVNYGLLRSLESEDELAALLAHEYSHILLGHQVVEDYSQLLGTAVEAFQTYNNVKYRTQGGDAGGYIKNAVMGLTADTLSQNAFLPVFSREDEEEADKLGADLLIEAGYSSMGMIWLLQRVDSWDERIAEEKRLAREAEEKAAKEAGGDKPAFSLDKLVVDFKEATGMIQRRHPPAKERIQYVRDYVRAFYSPEKGLLAPCKETYASALAHKKVKALFTGLEEMEKARVALVSEKPKEALSLIRSARCKCLLETTPYARLVDRQIAGQNKSLTLDTLKADCQRDDVLFAEYLLLVDEYEGKETAKALEVAENAYASLDKADVMLPVLIRLKTELGKSSLDYLVTCKSSGNSELVSQCEASAQVKKLDK